MTAAPGSSAPFRAWVLASRPGTLLAAFAPVWVGICLAVSREAFAAGPAVAALAGALLIQIGTNLANDYYDHARGVDTEERVGPTRVTQAGLLEPRAVLRGALLVFALAAVVGVYLVWVGGWPILAIGLASLAAGLAYTAGPRPLASLGLGDPFVFVFFGLVAVAGTYWVQALEFRWELLWAGTGVGALNTNILVANNLRDLETDARSGRRTLAVRMGRAGTRTEYLLLLVLALSVPPVGVWAFDWSVWSLMALAAAFPAIPPLQRILRRDDPRDLVPALAESARVVAVYGVLLGVGLVAEELDEPPEGPGGGGTASAYVAVRG